MKGGHDVSGQLITRGLIVALVVAVSVSILLAAVIWALPLPEPEIAQSSRVLDIHGRLIRELYVERRTPVPLGEIPEVLRTAILAVEDERFYRHRGIDPIALVRAALVNWRQGRIVEGGSTISQQLVKNLYLSHERTYYRKIIEALYTIKLEMRMDKEAILEMYVNQIYLGHGAYGVESAAHTYFDKSVRDLDLAESALLVGIIRSPENYSPYNHPKQARVRRNQVLDRMEEKGHIRSEDAESARRAPIRTAGLPGEPGAPYFTAYLLAEIQDRHPDLVPLLHRGGLTLQTSLDLEVQHAAEMAVAHHLVTGREDDQGILQPQVALVALAPQSGEIRAMIGGRDYAQTQLNRAWQAFRPPGSAFKFFVYIAVTAQGYPPTSVQGCEPVRYPSRDGTTYSPRNFDNTYAHGPVDVRHAIATSNNVVAVRWTHLLGPAVVREYASLMGIDSPLHDNLSLALGTAEVSPLELTAALLPLANGGLAVQPVALLSITDQDGNSLYTHQARQRPVLDARVSFLVSQLFTSVFSPGGTAHHLRAAVDFPVAGKTGTTTGLLDAWFIGYNPALAASVWVGHDGQERSLPGTGGTVAGPIWASFMQRALPQQGATSWQLPVGVVELDICADTGLLPGHNCPTRREFFLAETQPRTVHRIHLAEQESPGQDEETDLQQEEEESSAHD